MKNPKQKNVPKFDRNKTLWLCTLALATVLILCLVAWAYSSTMATARAQLSKDDNLALLGEISLEKEIMHRSDDACILIESFYLAQDCAQIELAVYGSHENVEDIKKKINEKLNAKNWFRLQSDATDTQGYSTQLRDGNKYTHYLQARYEVPMLNGTLKTHRLAVTITNDQEPLAFKHAFMNPDYNFETAKKEVQQKVGDKNYANFIMMEINSDFKGGICLACGSAGYLERFLKWID